MIEGQRVVSYVFNALKNDAAFSTAVGGRVYRDQVPQSAPLPSAIVSLVSDVDVVTLGGRRVHGTVLVDVHLIASGASYGPINAAADRADVVLDQAAGTTGGAVVVKLRRDAAQAFLENEAGVVYAHVIQTYRTEAYAVTA